MSEEKEYYVQLPIAGIVGFTIIAESEEDAIEKAIMSDQVNTNNFEEWDAFEHICEGNVCHAPLFDAIAEEV